MPDALDNRSPSCGRCRYDLSDLPAGKCPECGTRFDPAEPGTLRHPSPRLAWVAGFSPPRWLLWLYGIALGMLAVAINNPAKDVGAGVAMSFLFAGPIPVWALLLLMQLAARGVLTLRGLPCPRWRVGWLILPAMWVCVVVIHTTACVWWLRWWAAEAAFRSAAKDPAAVPGWIGGFRVTSLDRNPTGAVAFTLGLPDGLEFDSTPVLIYSPRGAPTLDFAGNVGVWNIHLGDGWYGWFYGD